MLSYVILISIAIAISITVFAWLQLFIDPRPEPDCEEGTYISIYDYSCDDVNHKFSLTIKNNGRFTVHGFSLFVGSDSQRAPGDQLVIFDISRMIGGGKILFKVPLLPGETEVVDFNTNAPDINFEYIRKIKMQPFIVDSETNGNIVCESVVLRQDIDNCKVKSLSPPATP